MLKMGFWRDLKTDACENKRVILAGTWIQIAPSEEKDGNVSSFKKCTCKKNSVWVMATGFCAAALKIKCLCEWK